ncbi:hypothetical protein PGB90_001600 [Kerria lacca]
MTSVILDKVEEVEIDDSGDFKYILVSVSDQEKNSKLIVRGNARGFYHVIAFNGYEYEIGKRKRKIKLFSAYCLMKYEGETELYYRINWFCKLKLRLSVVWDS